MNTIFHTCDPCRNPFLLMRACPWFFDFIISQGVLPSREGNWLKTDVWKLSLQFAPVKVSDNRSAWESWFPGRPLGDISFPQFIWSWFKACGITGNTAVIPSVSEIKSSKPPKGTLRGWFRIFCWNGERGFVDSHRVTRLTCDSGKVPGGFQGHLLLLPLLLSLWPHLWQGDSWVPPALFICTISFAFIPALS